jgi:hypothetical protein
MVAVARPDSRRTPPDQRGAAGLHPIIALWAHQRARSTAFLRMMIERGDVTVIHEPLVTLIDTGEVALPDGRGGQTVVHSDAALFEHLRALAQWRPVFFKDTVEHRYGCLFEQPQALAGIVHTFIVREPRRTISSAFEMKPTITCAEVGYEHLAEIFDLAMSCSPTRPAVIDADRLVQHPAEVVRRYCEHVGLPFLQHAMTWQASDRPEWSRTRQWHTGVACSSGFGVTSPSVYPHTVDNHPTLRRFLEHHEPYYRRLVRHAL